MTLNKNIYTVAPNKHVRICLHNDGNERKDLIQISHRKYHYTEIIFTNSFEAGQKAIQKDIKKNYIKKS